jgi:hypothetical protein
VNAEVRNLKTPVIKRNEAVKGSRARNASPIALASPFASAYPEWRKAREELEWKSKMPKQSNGDPHDSTNPNPSTDDERQARLKELAKLTTREKLLRIMNMIGDERVGDDQLLRVLIVLEDAEPNKNQGS